MKDIGWQVPAANLTAPTHNPGDTNHDGTVDLTDLNAVLNNFGTTYSATTLSTVPEPATLSLLALPTVILIHRRRKI
jgi:hypothetical protein